MNKITLKALNLKDLENKIKANIHLQKNETYTIREIKKPFNLLFIHIKGIYEITILTKAKSNEQEPKIKKEIKKEKIEDKVKPEVKATSFEDEILGEIKLNIERLLDSFNMDIKLSNIYKKNNLVFVNFEGRDVKYIIGEKGIALNSLEYLINSTYNYKNLKIVLDANNYRQKREKSLITLANKKAQKVIETKKYVKLSPMSSKERRVIHEELSKYSEIETKSQGNEPKRYLVIKYIGDNNE